MKISFVSAQKRKFHFRLEKESFTFDSKKKDSVSAQKGRFDFGFKKRFQFRLKNEPFGTNMSLTAQKATFWLKKDISAQNWTFQILSKKTSRKY